MQGSISSEMASLAVAGIVIVFGVLALIAAVVALFKRLDDRWQAAEARAERPGGRQAADHRRHHPGADRRGLRHGGRRPLPGAPHPASAFAAHQSARPGRPRAA